MIGLALVTLVTMLATSIRASFFGAVDKIFVADYAVTAQNNFDLIPTAIGETLRQTPGVSDVVGVRVGDMRIFGRRARCPPSTPAGARSSSSTGSPARQRCSTRSAPNGAFTDKDYAKKHNLTLGSPVQSSCRTASGRRSRSRGSSIRRRAARRSTARS